jgi:uncharacterized protein
MTFLARGSLVAGLATPVVLGVIATAAQPHIVSAGANGLLHPQKRAVDPAAHRNPAATTFSGAGVTLAGWWFHAAGKPHGTVVYLHGVADNRGSSSAAATPLTARGYDVVAYDSRAHGESGGEACTYGFYEKLDLARVLDTLPDGPIVLIGSSLGAAVALQAAAEDERVSAVVAAESFSDLRTVAAERAPWFFTRAVIRDALALAGDRARFDIDSVSPMRAAGHIRVPVLIIHGAEDVETSPVHSRRIFDALTARKRLLIVPGAGHNQSLQPATWPVIEEWIDSVVKGERS